MKPFVPTHTATFGTNVRMARALLNGHRAIDVARRYHITAPGVMHRVRGLLRMIVASLPADKQEEGERMLLATSLSSQNFYRDRGYWSNQLATVENEWLPAKTPTA